MSNTKIDAQSERELITQFFAEARAILSPYFQERQFTPSNAQIFAFTLVSPIAIAIASDGTLDFSETTMLVDIATYFERISFPQEFNQLPQPKRVLSDADFRKIIYSELRYLCLTMPQHEAYLIEVLKKLIQLDDTIGQDAQGSIRHRIVEMMHSVIYNNLGSDSVEEAKIKEVLAQLGIAW